MKMYEIHPMKNPQLPFIFNSTRLRPNYRSSLEGNWHENIEIIIVTDGIGEIRINEIQIPVTSGDIVIANPNCLHGFSSVTALSYYYLIVDRSFCIANYFDTNELHFDEHIKDSEIFVLCLELAEEYKSLKENNFAVQAIRAKVLLILSLLCRRYNHADPMSHEDTHLLACIKQAVGYIHSESNRDLSLEETATFTGLSKYYFAHEFKRITGYTFVSYLTLVRCKKAKRMLFETQKSIGEISAECGFSDQSYFTKVFKKYYGVLPAEYRKQKQNKKE